MILHGENLNSAGSNDYRIQIEAVGRCAVTQVTATEIHCRPDLSSIAESVIATIQVSCSLSTTFVIRGERGRREEEERREGGGERREGEEGGGGEERGRRVRREGGGGRRWRGKRRWRGERWGINGGLRSIIFRLMLALFLWTEDSLKSE